MFVKTAAANEGLIMHKQGANQLGKRMKISAGETIKVEVEFDFSSPDAV